MISTDTEHAWWAACERCACLADFGLGLGRVDRQVSSTVGLGLGLALEDACKRWQRQQRGCSGAWAASQQVRPCDVVQTQR